MKKAKQARPTREEVLEGIGYTPLTFPASLQVPEAVRAAEERANQDYVSVRRNFRPGNRVRARERNIMTNYTRVSSPRQTAWRAPLLLHLALLAPLAMLMPYPAGAQTATYQTLYSFKGTPDGTNPRAAVIIGSNGEIYGNTYEGEATS